MEVMSECISAMSNNGDERNKRVAMKGEPNERTQIIPYLNVNNATQLTISDTSEDCDVHESRKLANDLTINNNKTI